MEVTFLGLEVTIPDDPVTFIKAKAIELLNHLGYEWPTSNEDMLDQWAELGEELLSRGLGITWRDTSRRRRGDGNVTCNATFPSCSGVAAPTRLHNPRVHPAQGSLGYMTCVGGLTAT